jgi:hypothetical protein
LSVPNGGELSLLDACIKLADPTKLKRFDALAEEFRQGRKLIALLSKPGGNGEYIWAHQYELRKQGKDAFQLCCELQDLFGSLLADFLAAGAAGHFTLRGFLGCDEKQVPPLVLRDPRLRLRLDEDAVELPDGNILRSVRVRVIQRDHDPARPQLPMSQMAQASGVRMNKCGKPSTPTASYPAVKDAVQKRGSTTEAALRKAVSEALQNKHVPRELVRRARDELFGKPGRSGRPKSAS